MCEFVRRERERSSTIFATGTQNERIETMTCAMCENYGFCEISTIAPISDELAVWCFGFVGLKCEKKLNEIGQKND